MDQIQKPGSSSTSSDQEMDMEVSDEIVFVQGTRQEEIYQFLALLMMWGTTNRLQIMDPAPNELKKLRQGLSKIARWSALQQLQIILVQYQDEDDISIPIQLSIQDRLQNIEFNNLSHLMINHCSITSLEFLLSMSMPNLKKLNLSQNYITTIKSLRKLNCPCLTEIDLSQNYIVDMTNFSQFNQSCLRSLNIDNVLFIQSHTNVLGYAFKVKADELYISVSMKDIAYQYEKSALDRKFINQQWSVI